MPPAVNLSKKTEEENGKGAARMNSHILSSLLTICVFAGAPCLLLTVAFSQENPASADVLIPEMEQVFDGMRGMIEHTNTVLGHAVEIQKKEGGDLTVVKAAVPGDRRPPRRPGDPDPAPLPGRPDRPHLRHCRQPSQRRGSPDRQHPGVLDPVGRGLAGEFPRSLPECDGRGKGRRHRGDLQD